MFVFNIKKYFCAAVFFSETLSFVQEKLLSQKCSLFTMASSYFSKTVMCMTSVMFPRNWRCSYKIQRGVTSGAFLHLIMRKTKNNVEKD